MLGKARQSSNGKRLVAGGNELDSYMNKQKSAVISIFIGRAFGKKRYMEFAYSILLALSFCLMVACGGNMASSMPPPVQPIIIASENVTTGATNLAASVSMQENCTFVWTITGGAFPGGATSTTGREATFSAGDVGTLALSCKAKNSAGVESLVGVKNINVVATPSIISFTSISPSVPMGTATILTAVFTGGEGTIDNGLGAVTSGTGISTGNLAANTTFTLTVANLAGTSVSTQSTVLSVQEPLVITVQPISQTRKPGQSATFTIAASGIPTPTYQWEQDWGYSDWTPIQGETASSYTRVSEQFTRCLLRCRVSNIATTIVSNVAQFDVSYFSQSVGPDKTLTNGMETECELLDGRILYTGQSGAAIFDPSTGISTRTMNMIQSRTQHSSIRLLDGRVLIFGGLNGATPQMQTEIYDPSLNQFIPGNSLAKELRWLGRGVVFSDGNVILFDNQLSNLQMYDSNAGSFLSLEPPPFPSSPRLGLAFSVTKLTDDSLLIIYENPMNAPASAYLYNYSSKSFSSIGKTNCNRTTLVSVLLNDGRVLISGRPEGQGPSYPYYGAEIFDPKTKSFLIDRDYPTYYTDVSITPLSDGSILITGGMPPYFSGGQPFSDSGWIYRPNSSIPATCVGRMVTPRVGHRARLLKDGRVLITGGFVRDSGSQTELVEIFQM